MISRFGTTVIAASVLAIVAWSECARAAITPAPEACQALQTTDFSGIQDAPTQVMEAGVFEASAEAPAHCLVQGYIAPQVGFELQLPTTAWNGKFIEVGCGGYCGGTRIKGRLWFGWCDDALRRGYACIVSNQGHTSTKEGFGPNTSRDGLWAYNNLQAEFDYGVRAAHVAALAGKAITQRYYGAAPKRSYFMGCSGGGRQALVEAQRFPWDFDGIIAFDPANNLMCTGVALLWNGIAMTGSDGKSLFTPADLDVLHQAVLARCDLDDGVKDGVIGYPPGCKFDPAELVCGEGRTSACLSQAKVDAARKVYSGPVTSDGTRLFAASAMPGTEKGTYFSGAGAAYKADWWRYLGFMPDPGPGWQASDFDFDTDYKRLGLMGAIYAADNPDLRRFKGAGGKLMVVQGWDDSGSPLPLNTIDYYETVERTMGGREATQEFARLFMIPGRAHCGGGPGAGAADFLGHLEAWVEQGRAPDMMIGAHIGSRDFSDYGDYVRLPADLSEASFTRPIYPYPLRAKYTGAGDPDDYRNFESVAP